MLLSRGTQRFSALDPELSTVAEVLAARGWATAALVNNPFLAPEFGLGRGFDLYDYAPGTNAEMKPGDRVILYGCATQLAELDQRCAGSEGDRKHDQACELARESAG